ncbi:MAG: thioredoxin [bacterium]|nr:thioredoxin [bacterium]
MSDKTVHFTDQTFKSEVLGGGKPVLVDFWAAWCGPCRALAPVVDELAEKFDGSATIGKLDVDENPEAAKRYGITSIPTILIFKDGEVVNQLVGVRSVQEYEQLLNETLVEV